ncbi:MAG: chemotaxis-specific protein-glutamate methyltransferase CheB, partial [Planctomycetota bacterium]
IVDDSAVYRQAIREALSEVPTVEVIGIARDGLEAIRKIAEQDPDAITLEFALPGLDGFGVLEQMRHQGARAKAIMVSSRTEQNVKLTTDALMKGAFDFVLKPTGGTPEQNHRQLRQSLADRMKALAEAMVPSSSSSLPGISERADATRTTGLIEAVVIGSSTGGPIALRQVIPALRSNLRVPVIIVQHMPGRFTGQLAEQLDELSEVPVREIVETTPIEGGTVYLATGGKHTELYRQGEDVYARLTLDPPEHHCRPAVDFTLRSAIGVFGGRLLSVILTGMGKDGQEGCRAVSEAGGRVFAQHPEDCGVYGMPKAVIESGLAHAILHTDQIAVEIHRMIGDDPSS